LEEDDRCKARERGCKGGEEDEEEEVNENAAADVDKAPAAAIAAPFSRGECVEGRSDGDVEGGCCCEPVVGLSHTTEEPLPSRPTAPRLLLLLP
jgi:hypothetical protein